MDGTTAASVSSTWTLLTGVDVERIGLGTASYSTTMITIVNLPTESGRTNV